MINLVTGGAGFIGSYLIDNLIQKNEKVICLDNFLTGKVENIKRWYKNPNFKLINHDIINPIELDINKIWHFACPASPYHYQLDPINTAKINFLGTYNMLKLAKNTNARILIASSSEIYGNPELHPQKETYTGSVKTFSDRACYVEGKRIAETLSFDFNKVHNTEIRIARIFNAYGPRMLPNDGRVISNFICQAILGKELTVYGKGNQTRCFCFINDLIEGLNKLMSSKYAKPVNLGSQKELSIIDLAKLIKRKVNDNIKIVFKDLPNDDPMRRKPDLSLAKKILNWESHTSIEKGIDTTINHFSKIIKA